MIFSSIYYAIILIKFYDLNKYYISILTEFIMTCHYSCATCSSNVYMFSCLSCPSTRSLLGSTCVCSSGYYQGQQSTCYPSEQASTFTQLVLPLADILYYTNIGIFWLYIIVVYCRVNSPKIRILVNFAQMIALVNNYPFLLDQISKQFLWSLSAYNFQYFLALFTCTDDSTVCKLFEYVWQPILVLPSFVVCLLFSFIVMNACYRGSLQESINFINYWKQSWTMILYTFIDFTAVILSYNITKAALLSNWGFIFVGLYLVGIIGVVVYFFRVINSKQQSKVIERGRYSWAYGYDQNYHLYFIDYLYQQARHKPMKQRQNNMEQNIKQNKTVQNMTERVQKQQGKNNKQQIRMFMPHSNLYLLQLFIKLMLGSTTVLLYEYKPTLIVYSLIILLNIGVCWLGAFFYYDKFTLLLYWVLSLLVLFSTTFYSFSIYWFAAIGIGFIFPLAIFAIFVVLFFYNKKINGKLINKMFIGQQYFENKNRKIGELSEQQMKIERQQQQQEQGQNKPIGDNTDKNNSQVNNQKKLPFTGNLTRKVIQKRSTKDIIGTNSQQQENLGKTKTNSKSKTIFKDMIKQQQGQPSENVIRHSQFQKKISNTKTKMTARNRTKNAFINLEPIEENAPITSNQHQDKNQSEEESPNDARMLPSREIQLSNKTSHVFQQTNKSSESNLQNLLRQPSQKSEINTLARKTKKSKQQSLL